MKPKTIIKSITRVTDIHLGILYRDAWLISGLQAIAIKIDNKNGTIMALAALMPAKTTITAAVITMTLAVEDFSSIVLSAR
jgi:hypothetical protein